MWMLVCAILHLASQGAAEHINGKPLHFHMNKRELEHYFGSSDHSQVPEYEVVSPYHSNDDGGFVSFDLRGGRRLRRSLADLNRPSYKLRAFGEDLHLKLVRNDRLMAPGLQFEENLASSRISRSPAPENTFYLGHIASDPDSLVAVSNDDGLKGLIRHKKNAMFIHPLPDHLAKHFRTKRETQPHLIYKTDQFINRTVYEEDEEVVVESDAFNSDTRRARTERDVSNNDYKFLEVGLVADNLVFEKYGERNIANHLLLMANIVSGMFLDKSIGNKKIVLVVKRIGTVHYDDLGVHRHSERKDKLIAMTNFMKENFESKNDEDPSYVDEYVFIGSNVAGGLAGVNSICRGSSVGSITGDGGLSSAGIVAHEIGHTMGIGHDDSSASPFCPGHTYIMSSVLPGGPTPYKWSPCSQTKLQEFLNDDRSKCLEDLQGDHYTIPHEYRYKLPGEVVSADQQCKDRHGDQYYHCSQMQTNCGTLWCTEGGSSCVSGTHPALDGSWCGGRSWCIRGECVDNGYPYIDGGWSEWSNFVPCTMTCGGGITYKERTCTNPPPQNGGKSCEGSLKGHYKICNPQPCSEGHKSYRQKACEEWDPQSVPYWAEGACTLYCIKGKTKSKRGPVKDGARCTQFKKNLDVCVDGKCTAVGCDHQLGSGVQNDYCGVCGGNRTSCSPNQGNFTYYPKRSAGPFVIIELPIGTTHASFEEKLDSNNKIVVQDSSGVILNGKTFEAGDAIVHYTGKSKGRDKLTVVGPTSDVLKILCVRRQNAQPRVAYTFYTPLNSNKSVEPYHYNWKEPGNDSWSDCSASCGGGTQTRAVYCVRSDDKSRVGDQWCSAGNKPSEERECNVQPCQPEWYLSRWEGLCSKSCGNGVQTRSLVCHRKVKDLGFQQVSDDLCVPKPNISFERGCRQIKCPPVWKSQDIWSQCSTSCDPGIATRKVWCVQTNEIGHELLVPDILCVKDDKPPTQKACNLDNGCAPSATTCPALPLCQNCATCVDDPAGYKCKCKEGYKGYFCEAQIDPCDKSPCLNGATCIQDDVNFLEYTCQCPIGYTGKTCEVRINPCDSSPCLNGGGCVPDDEVVMKYTCICTGGHSGKVCEVPPSYRIACFKNKNDFYSVILGDLKEFLDKDVNMAINMCREWAYTRDYKKFAVDYYKSKCLAAKKEMDQTQVASDRCSGAAKGVVFVYSFEPPPSYTDLGCYKEGKGKKRVLKINLADLKTQADDVNARKIVEQCAYMARYWGYDFFAVIDRRMCVSSKDAADKDNILGEITENVSDYCKDGVGLTKASMEVYHF